MKNALSLIFFILLCEAVGIAGAFFTVGAIPTWFQTLSRPSIAPPNWIFGPVWTLLYAMMGIVLWMLWKNRNKENFSSAMKIFFIQLFLNGIWTPIFFGLKNLGLALVVISLLWISIAYLIYLLAKIKPISAWLLVPYLAWVSFATVLNYFFFVLNR